MASGKQTVTTACPKDNLGGIQEFSSPENTTELIERRVKVSMRRVVLISYELACSRRSDSVDVTKNSEKENTAGGWGWGERADEQFPLLSSFAFFPPLLILHHSPLSERLKQVNNESVDKILWCDNSNEAFLKACVASVSHRIITLIPSFSMNSHGHLLRNLPF